MGVTIVACTDIKSVALTQGDRRTMLTSVGVEADDCAICAGRFDLDLTISEADFCAEAAVDIKGLTVRRSCIKLKQLESCNP
ncbi:UNVERIFIED_CONTAM: hypothetical protein K2H54_055547 [Gekko kuhli]